MADDKPLGEQVLDELAPWTATGDIVVQEKSDYWWDLLRSKYPAAIGQIDWLNVPNWQYNLDAVPHIPDEGVISGDVLHEQTQAIRRYLQVFAGKANISPHDKIIVLGDGITDGAFEMSFDTLLMAFPILFSPPEHTYVIPLDAAWCFTFMLECEMHFGSASLVKQRRRSADGRDSRA